MADDTFQPWDQKFGRRDVAFRRLAEPAPPAPEPAAQKALGKPAAPPPPTASAPQPAPDPSVRLAELEEREKARQVEHAAAMKAAREAEAKARQQAERLEAAARGIESARQSLVLEFRDGAAQVILEAARRIGGDALRADAALLDALVAEAADALGKAQLRVRVSPLDAEALRARLATAGIEVVEDPTVSGGCVVEGPSGRIDASVDSALASVAAVLEQWKGAT